MSEKTAVVFPGQGSQELGMADAWNEHRIGRDVLDEASNFIGIDIVSSCRESSALNTTEFVQPALLACEVAAHRVLLDSRGVPFDATAGHSLGQFSSLVAAEVLSFNDALKIVTVRGKAMQNASRSRPGGMMAFLGRFTRYDAQRICSEASMDHELIVANVNAPGQVIISGTHAAIQRAETLALQKRIKTVSLDVAGAFHSELMRSAVEPILDAIWDTEFKDAKIPVADNVTGKLTWEASTLRSNLERHVVSPVRWQECVVALGRFGVCTFIEAGPGRVLTGLGKKIARDEEWMGRPQFLAVNEPSACA